MPTVEEFIRGAGRRVKEEEKKNTTGGRPTVEEFMAEGKQSASPSAHSIREIPTAMLTGQSDRGAAMKGVYQQLGKTGWADWQKDPQYRRELGLEMIRTQQAMKGYDDKTADFDAWWQHEQQQHYMSGLRELEGAYQQRQDFYSQFKDENEYGYLTDIEPSWERAQQRGLTRRQWHEEVNAQAENAFTEIEVLEDIEIPRLQREINRAESGMQADGNRYADYMDATREAEALKLELQDAQTRLNAAYENARKYGYQRQFTASLQFSDLPEMEGWEEGLEERRAEAEAASAQAQEERRQDINLGDLFDSPEASFYEFPQADWTQEEKDVFAWYWHNDPETAKKIAVELNTQHRAGKWSETQGEVYQYGHDNLAVSAPLGTVSRILTSPLGLVDWFGQTIDYMASGYEMPRDTFSPRDYANTLSAGAAAGLNDKFGTLPEDWAIIGGKGWGDAYQLANSIGESMAWGALSKGLTAAGAPEWLGATVTNMGFFGNAAAETTQNALLHGASSEEAMWLGFAAGAAEAIGETVSIEHLIHITDAGTMRRLLWNALKQGGIEASEEAFTTLINTVADAWIMGDKSEYNEKVRQNIMAGMSREEAEKAAWQDWAEGIAQDALGGFLSGGVSGGVYGSVNMIQGSRTEYSGTDRQALLDAALQMDPNGKAYQLAQKIQQQGTMSYNEALQLKDLMGERAELVSREVSDRERADIQQRAETALKDAGVENPGAAAQLIAKQVMGEELTRDERRVLKGVQQAEKVSTALQQMRNLEQNARYNQAQQRRKDIKFEKNGEAQKLRDVKVKGGKTATVTKATMEKGKLALEVEENGKTRVVSTEDLELDSSQRQALDTLTRVLGKDAAAAYNGLDLGKLHFGNAIDMMEYATAWANVRDLFGYKGASIEAARAATSTWLTEEQVQQAYNVGKQMKERGESRTEAREGSKRGSGEISMDGLTITNEDGSKTTLEGVKDRETVANSREYKTLEALAKALDIDVVLFEGDAGNRVNGAYVDGTIYLDWSEMQRKIEEEGGDKWVAFRVMGHELTHFIQQNAPELYDELKDFITSYLSDKMGKDFNELVNDKMQREFDANGRTLSYEAAVDEVIADACETMLRDSQAVRQMMREHMTLWEKICDFFDSILKKIQAQDDAAKLLEPVIEQVQEIWDRGLAKAVESRETALEKYGREEKAAVVDGSKAQLSVKDAEYVDAVKRGDMDTAQRMVDEAAKAAGYTVKAFHGTRSFGFTVFDPSRADDGISLFVTSNRRTAETYSGETNRNRIKDRETKNADDLHGEQLIEEARNHKKQYQDYKLMSDKDKTIVRDDAKSSIEGSIRRAQEFVRDHRDAFDSEKAYIMDRLISSLYHLRDSETGADISEAWTEWEDALWDLKGMDDSIAIEFLEDVDSRGLFQNKNVLDDMTYQGDMYADWYVGGPDYIFDNQLQIELNAEYHKGIYELWCKPGKQLVFDANGENWNQITPPKELQDYGLYGPQRTRDISSAAKALGYDSVLMRNLRDNGGETAYNGASDVSIFFDANALKSADPVTYDDKGEVIPLSERFNQKTGDIRFSLKPVKPVQPSSNAWSRTHDTAEAMEAYPNLWNVAAEESEKRNPTQIASTQGTYRNIYKILQRDGFTGKILDASSGLGLGTKVGREEFGFDVDDIEPYPDASYKPKYTDYSKLNKKYDAIISSAVLNVLPQDQRDALVVKMGELLNPGGRMFITTRGKDVETLGNTGKNIHLGNMEWIETVKGSYQKGFTQNELKAYLEDALGSDFTVELSNAKNGGKFNNNTSIVVTKKAAKTGGAQLAVRLTGNLDTDTDTVYAAATPFQEELNEIVRGLSGMLGTEYEDSTQKSKRSIKNKVIRKHGDGRTDYSILDMKDHARSKVYVNSWDEIPRVLAYLRSKGVKYETEAIGPTPYGYKGFHVTWRNNDGLGAELQITMPHVWQVKLISDGIYDKWRDVADLSDPRTLRNYQADLSRSKEMWRDLNLPDFKAWESSSSDNSLPDQMAAAETGYAGFFQSPSTNSSNLEPSSSSSRPSSVNTNMVTPPSFNSSDIIAQEGEIGKQPFGKFSLRSDAKTDRELLAGVTAQTVMSERLQQENEILRESVRDLRKLLGQRDGALDKLRRQLRLTKSPELRLNDAKRMTRSLLQDYDSRADAARIAQEVKELGEFILGTELTGEAYDQELDRRLGSIARQVVENAKAEFTEGTDVYKEIASRIKGKKISVDAGNLGDLGDFGAFRKSLFGKLIVSQRAANTRENRADYTSADQMYAELQADYGETIFPTALNEGEELQNIARALELAKPTEANPFAQDMQAAEESVRNRVLMDLYSGALELEAPTAADRAKSRRKALQDQIKQMQRENRLSEKESQRMAEQIYALDTALDKARSQYETLLRENAERRNELEKYRKQLDRYEQKEREVSQALNELDALVKEGTDADAVNKQRARLSDKERQMTEALQAVTKAQQSPALQQILQRERAIERTRTRERIREGVNRRDLRQRVEKLWKDMNRRITSPTEKKHIPVPVMQQAIEVLQALNMDTSREGTKSGEKLRAKLTELKARYEALQKDPDYRQAAMYDEQVADYLTNMIEQVGDTPINKMSVAQLESVLRTLTALDYVARHALKLKLGEEERSAYEVSQAMTRETRSVPKAKTGLAAAWLNAQLSAERMFRRLGGYHKNSTWEQVYRMLNDGQLRQTQIQMEGSMIFADLLAAKDYGKFVDPGSTVDIGLTDEDGNPVKITHGMMVSLWMHLQNEQNRRHVAFGGLTIPGLKDYYNGKKVKGSERATRIGGALQELAEINDRLQALEESDSASADEIAELEAQRDEVSVKALEYVESLQESIEKQLTDYDRQWIAACRELFDGLSKRVLNQTTLEVYGIKRANVENYFPIWVDGDFLNTPFETVAKDLSLENAGFMKERVDSSKPIRLADVSDVAASQIRKVSQYAGLMPAIRNFGKVWGKTQTGYRDSLRKAVHETFGQNGVNYIEHLMADLNGARSQDTGALGEFFNRMRGRMAQASLTMNLRVALGQTASYPTAAAVVGWKALHKALWRGGRNNWMLSRADQELIRKWSPLLYYRMQGYRDTELGDIAGMNSKFDRVWKKARWLTGWIQAMDGATVGRLWYAAEYYVQDHNKDLQKGSDEYYEAVAKVFNDIVERTQPNYSTMQRPDILRNPNALVKQLTMFMTQRLQNFNILYDAAATYSTMRADYKAKRNGVTLEDVRQAARDTRRAAVSQVAAGATIVLFKTLAAALMHKVDPFRDDDKELTPESVSMTLLDMFMDSMAGNVLFGTEVWDFAESKIFGTTYYGIELSGVGVVTDLIDAASTLFDHAVKGELSWKDADLLAKRLGSVAGIPYSNAMDIVMGGVHWVQDGIAGELFSFEAGVDRTTAMQAHRLYRAYQDKDFGKVNKIRAQFPEDKQKDLDKAVREYIREQYKAGDITVYEAMRQLQSYGNASPTVMADMIKDEYKVGNLQKGDAVKYLVEYAGRSQESAEKTVRELSAERDTGVKYSEINDQYMMGEISGQQATQMLVDYGGKDPETAALMVEFWDFQNKHPGSEMEFSQYQTYTNKYKPIGLSPEQYEDYARRMKDCKGVDADGDGKTDSGSKKIEVVALIDSMDLTPAQKDQMYLANNYAESGLKDCPWNK